MNSVPNNDSLASALSPKLGWVHQVHTLKSGCAHRPSTLSSGRPCHDRVIGHVEACRRPCRRPRRPYHRCPRAPLCVLYRPYRSSVCRIAALLRAASRYNPAAKLPSVMIHFIVSRHSPPMRPREIQIF